jgi:3-phosphoshikimate 1-carboxyvinyltransferase
MPDPHDQPGSDPASHLRLRVESLPDPLPLPTLALGHTFSITLRPPGSKSLTNRALLLAALADGTSTLRYPLLGADDTEAMAAALSLLGAEFTHARDSAGGEVLRVAGVGGRWRVSADEVVLDLRNAGTATRFLAAASLLSPVPITVDGNPRMRQRPIGQLVDALRQLGAECQHLGGVGRPPVRIVPPDSVAPGQRLELPTTASSQFISALLLIAPFVRGGLTLILRGDITSRSYIQMTVGLLDQLGAKVRVSEDMRIIRVGPVHCAEPGLAAFDMEIEPDASSATYFWAAASLVPGSVCRVDGLGPASLQPDAAFPELLAAMGAPVSFSEDVPSITVGGPQSLSPVSADLSLMPDAAMTLAAVACFAGGASTLRGLHTLRHKETDRIEALRTELERIGVAVGLSAGGDDTLIIVPPAGGVDVTGSAPRVEFETYDDHRMAMSLALIGLRRPNTFIRDPGCVRKTYPTYFADLARLYGGGSGAQH